MRIVGCCRDANGPSEDKRAMMKYVDLDRSFLPISKDQESTEVDYRVSLASGLTGAKKWSDLLELRRVIILAEARAGKTEELRETAERLRHDGRSAFFVRLEHVARDFELSFDAGSHEDFLSWLSTGTPGWFFLDSVDEARLRAPKDFETAIRVFGARLGDEKHRAHVYITSRPSEWRPDSDLALVRSQLPFIEPRRTPVEQTEEKPEVPRETATAVTEHAEDRETEPVEPQVFSLHPFDLNQIREFSGAADVQDCDAFVDAIERAEAEMFAHRPGDLLDLISYWKAHGRLTNRAKLVEDRISSQLVESDPDRARYVPLSAQDARRGVEMLAAAVTFQRRQRILIPEQRPDPELQDESIDARAVLVDWEPDRIQCLLQRPIFDTTVYGAVRFHHRSVREYLTATWLHHLLTSGKSRRAIEGLFFKELYGREVIVPSMRPILAWLILRDDRVRDKARRIAPEVFIEGGDPSELPISVRKDFLEQFCSLHGDQEVTDRHFDFSELLRFAHQDLGETVSCLLETYSSNHTLQQLLLKIAWQGQLRPCAQKAMGFALDTSSDNYTRIYAMRVIGAVGTDAEKKEFVNAMVLDHTLKNETLTGELVSEFAPCYLSIDQVLALVERMEEPGEHSYSWLKNALQRFSRQKCPEAQLLDWVDGLLILLKRTPVVERHIYEASKGYSWILPCAVFATERLIRLRLPAALHDSVLETISLAQSERLSDVYHSEEYALGELVPEWPELNRKLFWHEVAGTRRQLDKKKRERLTNWCGVAPYGHDRRFTTADFSWCLEGITANTCMDDRLVALSLAFEIYKNNGRGAVRRRAMKKAVSGALELEDALQRHLRPPAMSDECRAWKRRIAARKRKQKEREKKKAANRIGWCAWLRSHTKVLRDTSIASDGSVWTATNYLLHMLRHEREDTNKWVTGNWEDLIPEFGEEVARAFRDGCIDYWRRYCPPILSEGEKSKNGTPRAAIVGLAGLAMEAGQTKDWSKSLSGEEAAIACRYAVNELNGFPDWLPDLHRIFPNEVERAILAEIEWEFSQYDGDTPSSHILNDVAWHADWLQPRISNGLLSLLRQYEPKHDDTVQRALGIVLGSGDLDTVAFVEIAKAKLSTALSSSRRALWLAAYMCVDATAALEVLRDLLDNSPTPKNATDLAMQFIVYLLGDRRERVSSERQDYMKPGILAALIQLMHSHIRIAEDIDRAGTGAYAPELRDDAQGARHRLTQLLRNIPGKASYLALLDLADQCPNGQVREWFGLYARRRAEADAEGEPWQPEAIARFAEDAEKAPQNHRELFDLTVSRLLDLKTDLEEGDTSAALLCGRIEKETECRNLIGAWLREHSASKYSASQEEELADAKKPDIRIHGVGCDGPVPIELKIVDYNWSATQLLERLRNQLCGQYLRDVRSNCGVFLLVYQGKKKHWKHPATGKHLGFPDLLQLLDDAAKDIVAKANDVEALCVVGIDLPKRGNRTQ